MHEDHVCRSAAVLTLNCNASRTKANPHKLTVHPNTCRAVCKEELQALLAHPALAHRSVPLLIYANKMDLPHSLSHEQIAEVLGLREAVAQHPWHACRCCGLNGDGVRAGWDWLAAQLSSAPRAAQTPACGRGGTALDSAMRAA